MYKSMLHDRLPHVLHQLCSIVYHSPVLIHSCFVTSYSRFRQTAVKDLDRIFRPFSECRFDTAKPTSQAPLIPHLRSAKTECEG